MMIQIARQRELSEAPYWTSTNGQAVPMGRSPQQALADGRPET